jgi:hypothetical protein
MQVLTINPVATATRAFPNGDSTWPHTTAVDERAYGIMFVAKDGSSSGGVQYRYLIPWTNVQYVAPASNNDAFDFEEIRFSESGGDITLSLVNGTSVVCVAVDVRHHGVMYADGVNPGNTFRPWGEVAGLAQAV